MPVARNFCMLPKRYFSPFLSRQLFRYSVRAARAQQRAIIGLYHELTTVECRVSTTPERSAA